MTQEELDAIRTRVSFDDVSIHDVIPLLAEVERLRDAHAMVVQVSGELCEKCGWAMKFPGEKCRCELLAEVERLTAEVEAKVAQNVALIGMNGRLQLEVERLNALGALQSADIQRLTRRVAEDEADWMALRAEAATAFQRGVAAMREAAVVASRENVGCRHVLCHSCASPASAIRALPDPEDTE